MERLLQHDKSYTVSTIWPAPGQILRKKFAGTNVNGAEGALPSLLSLQMAGLACTPLRMDKHLQVRKVPPPHSIIPYNLSHMETDSLHKLVRPSAHIWITPSGNDARQHTVCECCLLNCSQRPPPASDPSSPSVCHKPLFLALNFLLVETISLLPVSTTAMKGANQDSWQRCYSNCI